MKVEQKVTILRIRWWIERSNAETETNLNKQNVLVIVNRPSAKPRKESYFPQIDDQVVYIKIENELD